MKKFKTFAICAVAVAAMSFTTAAVDPIDKMATSLSKTALNSAVELGYISVANEQEILDSGIITVMVESFVDSGYSISAAVDSGAEVAVAKGWFKDKASAKRALRQAINEARKSPSALNAVYNILGI